MPITLQIENLTKSYGDRMLFADVSFTVNEGDKIGIIARNGTGKTTMLEIIAGKEDYDSGSIIFSNGISVGYLPQTPPFDPSLNALENVLTAPAPHAEDWTRPDRAASLLGKLGVHDFETPMGRMSGGQVKRMAIARVLLDNPDLLILDEPTNHLDIDVIEWLQDYLATARTTLLMVTHDRYFLERVCNRIIEIDNEQIYSYPGSYDYYLEKRQERMENATAELARVKNLLRTELDWMRRQPQARGSKAKYRIDNFYQLQERSRVNLQTSDVRLDVKSSYIGSKIFEARGVSKAFGDKVILKDWSYDFARYDKVGVVGPNGVGKTTFIKMLQGIIPPDSGSFDIGQTVRWGYYSQEGMTDFDPSLKVIDAVRRIAEEVRIDDSTRLSAPQFLNRFLFSHADQQKYVGKLSGGERRRLYLATVLMQQPNFLILDEPTNDLDIVTLTILEQYLADFKGCLIVVSHDRYFLDKTVQHLFVFNGDGSVSDFPGDYSTYRHCLDEEKKRKRAEAKESEELPKNVKTKTPQQRKLSFKEKRELETLEKHLEELAAERADLEEKLSSGTLSVEELQKASKRISEVIEAIDEAEMRALELMELEG